MNTPNIIYGLIYIIHYFIINMDNGRVFIEGNNTPEGVGQDNPLPASKQCNAPLLFVQLKFSGMRPQLAMILNRRALPWRRWISTFGYTGKTFIPPAGICHCNI